MSNERPLVPLLLLRQASLLSSGPWWVGRRDRRRRRLICQHSAAPPHGSLASIAHKDCLKLRRTISRQAAQMVYGLHY